MLSPAAWLCCVALSGACGMWVLAVSRSDDCGVITEGLAGPHLLLPHHAHNSEEASGGLLGALQAGKAADLPSRRPTMHIYRLMGDGYAKSHRSIRVTSDRGCTQPCCVVKVSWCSIPVCCVERSNDCASPMRMTSLVRSILLQKRVIMHSIHACSLARLASWSRLRWSPALQLHQLKYIHLNPMLCDLSEMPSRRVLQHRSRHPPAVNLPTVSWSRLWPSW